VARRSRRPGPARLGRSTDAVSHSCTSKPDRTPGIRRARLEPGRRPARPPPGRGRRTQPGGTASGKEGERPWVYLVGRNVSREGLLRLLLKTRERPRQGPGRSGQPGVLVGLLPLDQALVDVGVLHDHALRLRRLEEETGRLPRLLPAAGVLA